jgi:hypothetical protein
MILAGAYFGAETQNCLGISDPSVTENHLMLTENTTVPGINSRVLFKEFLPRSSKN